MQIFKNSIIISLAIILSCCKKNKPEQFDFVDVKGKIINACKDSGYPNLKVEITVLSDKPQTKTTRYTDTDGNFLFKDFPISRDDGQSYVLSIDNVFGATSQPTFTDVGVSGRTIIFSHTEAKNFFMPMVTSFSQWLSVFNNKSPQTNSNDSVVYSVTNSTFQKNVPALPVWVSRGYGNINSQNTKIGAPTGKYIIKIDSWVSGVHSQRKDSVYVGIGTKTTYTLNW